MVVGKTIVVVVGEVVNIVDVSVIAGLVVIIVFVIDVGVVVVTVNVWLV